ncbi:ABC transporter substrate-binding protein [soil metagenome]
MIKLISLWLCAGLLFALAACGSAQEPTTSAPVAETTVTTQASGFPLTLETAIGPLTMPARPEAIVSLAPTATEMLAAIGASGQLVAVDDQSNYPADVPITDLSGFTPNIEAIASYQPDLVVISNDIDNMVASLQSLEIPVLLLPAAATLDNVYQQIELLGAATGHVEEAEQLTAQMSTEISELVAGYTPPAEPVTYYHELDPVLFSVTSSTFIGSIYSLFGLQSIADPADPDGFGYPQLAEEYIIESDPAFIFLADTGFAGQSPETVAARPGWDQLTAVTSGRVIPLDDDVASRWGPRVVDFVRSVAGAVALHPAG